MYKNNIKYNNLFEFIYNCNFTRALWPTYLLVKGFTLVDVGICESVYHISALVFEMPTGIVADLYGRKASRLIGVFVKCIELSLLMFASNIWMVIISFVLSAFGNTFESGANTAIVYDSLKIEHNEKEFSKVQGIREVIFQVSSLLSVIIGGYLASFSYNYAYIAAVVFSIFSAYFLIKMKEVPFERKEHESIVKGFKHQIELSIKTIRKDYSILFIMIFSSVFGLVSTLSHFYISTYWKLEGINISVISIMLALEAIAGIVAGILVKKIIDRYTLQKVILYCPILFVLGCMFLPNIKLGVIGIIVLGFADSIYYVTTNEIINSKIESEQRATLLSFSGLIFSLLMAVIFPVFGFIGDQVGLFVSFNLLTIIVMICTLIYFYIFKKGLKY